MEIVEQLFRQHYSKMLLIARVMLGNEEEAKDLVSDVFTEMLNGKLKVSLDSTEGFFVVLVRNRCLNLLRKKNTLDKVKECLSLDTSIELANEEGLLVNKIDQEVDKLEQMLRFIDSELTPQTRNIVIMHYRNKMTYRQISSELKISEAAVYKHLAQGIKRIREHFNPKNNGKD